MDHRLKPADSCSGIQRWKIVVNSSSPASTSTHSFQWDDDFRKTIYCENQMDSPDVPNCIKIKVFNFRFILVSPQNWSIFLVSYLYIIIFFIDFWRLREKNIFRRTLAASHIISIGGKTTSFCCCLLTCLTMAQRWISIENLLRSWKRALFSFVPPDFLFFCCKTFVRHIRVAVLWASFSSFRIFRHNTVHCLHFGHAYSGLSCLARCCWFNVMFLLLCSVVWLCVRACVFVCERRSMLVFHFFFSFSFRYRNRHMKLHAKNEFTQLFFFSPLFHAHNGRFI